MRAIEEHRPSRACAGSWRCLRAVSVSFVALGLALTGHLAGGGAPPSGIAFIGVWALASFTSWQLSRRRWTVRTLVGTLVLVQASMHALCGLQGGAMHGGASGVAMLAGHTAATAVSVAVLGYGEATAWALVDVLLLTPVETATSLASHPPRRAAAPTVVWPEARAVAARILLRSDPLRGPPVLA